MAIKESTARVSGRLMKEADNIKDIVGKTVSAAYDHDLIWVFFTDDTSLCVHSENNYGDSPITDIETGALEAEDELEFGWITPEQLQVYKEEQRQIWQKCQDEEQRRHYERLKQKFEK